MRGWKMSSRFSPSLKPDQSNPGVGDPFDPKSWEKAAPPSIVPHAADAPKAIASPELAAKREGDEVKSTKFEQMAKPDKSKDGETSKGC